MRSVMLPRDMMPRTEKLQRLCPLSLTRAELVVQRGGEFLAQPKHLPQQLVGTPERVYDVQYVVEVPANVAADDGDERGELREHKLP